MSQGGGSRRDLLLGALIALGAFTGYRWATGGGQEQSQPADAGKQQLHSGTTEGPEQCFAK